MADEYSVGNILIKLETIAKDQLSGLTQATTSLNELSKPLRQISKLNLDNFSNSFKTLSTISFDNLKKGLDSIKDLSKKNFSGITSINNNLKKIGDLDLSLVTSNLQKIGTLDFSQVGNALEALTGINTDNLTSLNKVASSIEKLANLNLSHIDFSKLKSQFQQLADAVDPFLQKLNASSASLQNFSNAINVGKLSQQTGNTTKEAKTFFNTFFRGINKFQVFLNYTKRARENIVKMLSSAIDFNETLNKFQVSMGAYYERSLEFVGKLTKAFNVSTESVMNYQATFKNMLGSLGGLAEETSYKLSETLTRMAIDYSSLFNVSIDTAMKQFQSVLSGQTKSIRTTAGYDITESTLFTVYQGLGGTKTVRQLDQVEKRLLRIIAVQQQMMNTNAVNDYANTINNTANVLKQIGETIKEIAMYIGQVLLIDLKEVFNTILGGAIAIREMSKSFAISRGYVYEVQGGLIDTTETIDNAIESVENLKKTLLGFDQINILGSSTTTGNEEDYSFLIDAINQDYGKSLDNIISKANLISESILKWLGYTTKEIEQVDELGNKIKMTQLVLGDDSNLNKMIQGFKTILATLTGITAMVNINKFLSFKGSETYLKSIENIKNVMAKALSPTGLLIGALIALFTTLYLKNENFRKSVNNLLSTFIDLLKPIIKAITEISTAIQPVFEEIVQILGETLSPIIDNLSQKFKGIVSIVKVIVDLITLISLSIVEIIKWSLPFVKKGMKFLTDLNKKIFSFINEIRNGVIYVYSLISKGINKVQEFFGLKRKTTGVSPAEGLNINVPKLATGGIVRQPTMAMIGEYSGASTNPEIVSPENKMREIFVDSMLPLAQTIVSSNERVVKAIKESGDKPISINGKKVSESLYDDLMAVSRRKGNNLRFS